MRIIDFHTHIYPEKIAQKATDSISEFYGLEGGGLCGTVEQLLQSGEKAGISEFVVLPVAIKPDHVRSINHFIVEQVANEPRFYGFGTVHAEQGDLGEEIEYIEGNGLLGVKMHPDTQRFNVDDERLFPVYERLQGKLPVLFHAGDTRYDYSHPARIRRVIDKFPKLTVIAAHFGGYSMIDTAYQYLKDTDCYLDISSSLMFMQPGEAERYIRAYGADRMLYGTDFPLWDPEKEVPRFLGLALTDREREQIAYENALHILRKN